MVQIPPPQPVNKGYPSGCPLFFIYDVILSVADGFPGQHPRPRPVDDAGSVCWRSGQNRQRRAGAPDDFGHRKRGSVLVFLFRYD